MTTPRRGRNIQQFSYKAGADLTSAAEGTLLNLTGSGDVEVAGANHVDIVGSLYIQPIRYAAGEDNMVVVASVKNSQEIQCIASTASIAVGDEVKCAANGRVTDTAPATGDFVVGRATTASTAAGDLILVDCGAGGYIHA